MFKMFNKTVSILAVLFFAFAMTSCSGLFESQETGSVSFSLSNDQLRSIISEKQSARALTQGNDDGSGKTMTVQIGIYSDDYEYLAGTKASATFANIEKGSGIELTIDDVPIGKSRLLALIYDSACNCENTYCGAEMITVTTGTNNVPVEMIEFKGAFVKEKTEDTYIESAVCSGEDDKLGNVLLLESDDKPFYAIIYGGDGETDYDYKVASIGIRDLKEWYPGERMPKVVVLTELAGKDDSLEKFDFLKTPNVINVTSEKGDPYGEPVDAYQEIYYVTYRIPFQRRNLELEGHGYIRSYDYYMNVTFCNDNGNVIIPKDSVYTVYFSKICIPDFVKAFVPEAEDLEPVTPYYGGEYRNVTSGEKFSIPMELVKGYVKDSVKDDAKFDLLIKAGEYAGYLNVKYTIVIQLETGEIYTSTDSNLIEFNLKADTKVATLFDVSN